VKKADKKKIEDLLQFLDCAPTPWHAVTLIKNRLTQAGFTELSENSKWKLKRGGAYFVSRNGSSLIAFVLPKKTPEAIRLAAAHTDSPGFKLKPHSETTVENMLTLGIEVYGSPLLNSWLNRDLGIAGRIIYLNSGGKKCESLINIDNHPVVIPQLAIHLDREIKEKGLRLNPQEHLSAVAALNAKGPYLPKLIKAQLPYKKLLGQDLFLYPLERPSLVGLNGQMLASYRYDNLGSSHAAVQGLLESKEPAPATLKMAALWDNEEVGSATAQGAASPFFAAVAERIGLALKMGREDYLRLLAGSLCVSVDQAHAFHPSHKEKHDPLHRPLLGKGIVIKHNAQQRYVSDARTAGAVVALCEENKIPYQHFAGRADIPSGSTIGPIHAAATGMPTVDIGTPQLSMHSCRELAAVEDHLAMCRLITQFLASK